MLLVVHTVTSSHNDSGHGMTEQDLFRYCGRKCLRPSKRLDLYYLRGGFNFSTMAVINRPCRSITTDLIVTTDLNHIYLSHLARALWLVSRSVYPGHMFRTLSIQAVLAAVMRHDTKTLRLKDGMSIAISYLLFRSSQVINHCEQRSSSRYTQIRMVAL